MTTEEMTVQTKSGRLLRWDGADFVGEEKDVSLARLRCESGFVPEGSFIIAGKSTLERLFVGMTGGADLDLLVASTRPLDFTHSVFAATIGTWH